MNIHLILDETSVASAERVTFHLNPATKHSENPVLLPGEPHQWDSLQVSWPATVLYSPSDRKFRCWYAGLDCIQTPERRWEMGYAESDDGVHWVKPELGQVSFLDKSTNRIQASWNPLFMSLAFENPLSDAPSSQRFGAYWTEWDWSPEASRWSKSLAWSPDGVQWTRHATTYKTDDRVSLHDICCLLYDEAEPDPAYRVKGYSQLYHDTPHPLTGATGKATVRHVGMVHGASFDAVQPAPNPVILSPEDGIDEEIHLVSVSKVGNSYLMLFESDNFSKNPIHGDLKLAVSSDGRKFRRIHPRQPFVTTGPKGSWDENLLVTTSYSMQPVGDEIYIYYIGAPYLYNSWPAQYAVDPARRGAMFAPTYLGVATLPRDRYAYVAGPGRVITHPFDAPIGDLWLNIDGDAQVAALDKSGNIVSEGIPGEERKHTVYRKVRWNSSASGAVQFRIALGSDTSLYSLGV